MLGGTALLAACGTPSADEPAAAASATSSTAPAESFLNQPLVSEIYTADPSGHVFDNVLYIYPSHDIDAGIPDDDLGSQYAMRDYRVLRMEQPGGPVTIGPVALDVDDVPWAREKMWAPDAAYKNGTYYLYFPAVDEQGIFRIGVATSADPMGPFTAEPQPIPGSFSMDPQVFTDTDGTSYMYFGGIWGGQLQRWATGEYNAAAGDTDLMQDDAPALMPKVARMSDDMKTFAEPVRDAVIVDADGNPILGGDHNRRFFEAAWLYKRDGRYYLTYSTGDTHYIAYATGDSPYGPFTYQGIILLPVQGWTNHHSIVDWQGKTWLLYHDTQRSGRNHLRNVKMTEIVFNPDGSIRTVDPVAR